MVARNARVEVTMRRIWVIADDLTGAADSGVCFVRPGEPVVLDLDPGSPADSPAIVEVADTDTRDADPAVIAGRITAVAGRIGPDDHVLKKIDSLFRGSVTQELRILRKMLPDRLMVVAPAVPALGRTTVGGHVRAGAAGTAMRIADHIPAGRPHHAGPGSLGTAVRTAHAHGADAVICDAATDDDLIALVRGALRTGLPLLWVGAAGLAAALAHALRPQPPEEFATHKASRVLVVVGSHSAAGLAQAKALAGHPSVEFNAAELPAEELPATDGVRVVSLTGDVDPGLRKHVAKTLGAICGPAVRAADVVILSGGATARAVLTAAGITSLRLLGEMAPGTVLSRPSGVDRPAYVITKSGSFGDEHALVRLVAAVTAAKGRP
jgi:uncharacterized protein YgbK (DUF1537 family)